MDESFYNLDHSENHRQGMNAMTKYRRSVSECSCSSLIPDSTIRFNFKNPIAEPTSFYPESPTASAMGGINFLTKINWEMDKEYLQEDYNSYDNETNRV